MSEETSYGIGEGPTANVSVSLRAGNIEAVRSRVGKRGFSAYVDAAVRRQIERDNLAELTAAFEEAHGTFTRAELEAADALPWGGADDAAEVGRASRRAEPWSSTARGCRRWSWRIARSWR